MIIKRAVKQIHADDTERFLLIDIRFVEHAHVNDDLARFRASLRLKPNAEPAVRFVMLLETARRDRVGENEKRALVAHLLVQSLEQQTVFMIEHRLQTFAADVTTGRPINRVAERHVVGRHRFRDCSRGAADMEKTPRHFLAGADLGKGAVLICVEINLERLLVRPNIHLGIHTNSVAAILDRRKRADAYDIVWFEAPQGGFQAAGQCAASARVVAAAVAGGGSVDPAAGQRQL